MYPHKTIQKFNFDVFSVWDSTCGLRYFENSLVSALSYLLNVIKSRIEQIIKLLAF